LCNRDAGAVPPKMFSPYYPSNFAQSPNGVFPKSNPILLQWNVGDSVTS